MNDRADSSPPPDHEDFKRVRRFGLASIKKYLDARRKTPPSDKDVPGQLVEMGERIAQLEVCNAELERKTWLEELLRFGGHQPSCLHPAGGDCCCGWAEVYGKAVAERG